jgi:hypothetical protein
MSESNRVNKLKEECLELFKLKSDFEEYENKAIEIAGKVRDFRLDHTIHPDQLRFLLVNPVKGKKLSDISYTEFHRSIEEYFRVKKTDFYFQISELSKFPNNYRLGYGVLLTFASLPKPIRIFAEELSKGKIAHEKRETERILKEIVKKIVIPSDPHIGYWLRIPTSAISYTKRSSQAFRFAEESLDILRIATPMTRIRLPQYAITLNADESKAFLDSPIEFNRCPYHPRKQKLIDRLSDICIKPSSPLERRIKDALHFYRIGDNYSPDHQKIFFYVAAIEHMIISGHMDLTFKFSQKGAILLAETRDERLDRFNKLKKLYQERSAIAHGEKTDYDFDMTTSAHHHVYDIITRMLELIESHGLQRVSPKEEKTGKSLDEYIDNILYSG